MKSSLFPRVHAPILTIFVCLVLGWSSAVLFGAEPAATHSKRVLDVNYGAAIATARFHVPPEELRELVYRLLDEDGFRVVRIVGSIPKEGQTLKAKKHLRRTECELIPDVDPSISTLSFEYGRFGNRDWSEKALKMIVAELRLRMKILDEEPRKIIETPDTQALTMIAGDTPKPAAISGTEYYESKVDIPPDNPLPIPALSIDPDSPAPFDTPAPPPPPPAIPDPLVSPVTSSAGGGEIVTLPGQKNGTQGPHPAETLFRGIQRGEINLRNPGRRKSTHSCRWRGSTPATRPATRSARRSPHGLRTRSRNARSAPTTPARWSASSTAPWAPAQVAAPAIAELKQQFNAILARGDFDDAEKSGWHADAGALLVVSPAP